MATALPASINLSLATGQGPSAPRSKAARLNSRIARIYADLVPPNTSLDLSGDTGLWQLFIDYYDYTDNLVGLNASGCTALQFVWFQAGAALVSLNLSGCAALANVESGGTFSALTSLNLSGCTNLVNSHLVGSTWPLLTSLNVTGCAALSIINGSFPSMYSEAVDAVLAALAAGTVENGTLAMTDLPNSYTDTTSYDALVARGWTLSL